MPSGIQHTPNLFRVYLPYKGLVGGVRLWDPAAGAALQTLGGYRDLTYAIAFSHDGKLLASASWLWGLATGTALQTLEVAVTVGRISFSRDAQYLETDTDSLCLVSSSNSIFLQAQPLWLIYAEEDWITQGAENLLWLLSDYKGTCSAVYNSLLALGHGSGWVTFVQFSALR